MKIGAAIRGGCQRLGRAMAKVKREKNYAGYWENDDGGMELRLPNAPPKENAMKQIRRRMSEGWGKVKDATGGKDPNVHRCKF